MNKREISVCIKHLNTQVEFSWELIFSSFVYENANGNVFLILKAPIRNESNVKDFYRKNLDFFQEEKLILSFKKGSLEQEIHLSNINKYYCVFNDDNIKNCDFDSLNINNYWLESK